ncbi:hypothetical protein ATANTOWER_029380 [Ataeniobius toweri]|uniref:Uncharacterized protein n=1 Tax=Ataeniobius toweri TaxID=208326 RepID=A0ABU7AHX6_9TELE|nr:hypothetical protein [Ataeniobius toweri]
MELAAGSLLNPLGSFTSLKKQTTLLKLISLITSRITAPMIPATTRLLSLAPVYNLPAVPQDVCLSILPGNMYSRVTPVICIMRVPQTLQKAAAGSDPASIGIND